MDAQARQDAATTKRIARAEARLAEIRAEQHRQMQFAGERMGVFARLRDLGREESRIVRRIDHLREP